MKKNLYYRTVIQRENVLKNNILNFFLAISSYPRLLIEVFIRSNFGRRYFSLSSALTVAIFLFAYPTIVDKIWEFFLHQPSLSDVKAYSYDNTDFHWKNYIAWYLFAIVFVMVSFYTQSQINKTQSIFDFKHYSLYSGDIMPIFFNKKIFGTTTNVRRVQILNEPAPFFIAGIIFWMLGQSLGWLLVLSSVCYSLGYMGAYRHGDDFILDKIDEMIMNEEMEAAFVQDESADKTRGVRFYMHKPDTEEKRRNLAKSIVVEDDDDDVSVSK